MIHFSLQNWHVILARKSAERYRDIESISGINFYTEAGFATVHSKCRTNLGELEKIHQLAKDTLVQGYNPQQVQLNFPKNKGFSYKKPSSVLN